MDSNERLEFLGDAVISLAVNHSLYDQFPEEREGHLTRLKTKLVSGKCLAALAGRLNLCRFLVMNRKALDEGWCQNPKMMEDCLEALVGALYLDQGYLAAQCFVTALLKRYIVYENLALRTNSKDELMFYTQSQKISLPEYRLLEVPGLTNFAVQTFVDGSSVGLGCAATKKEAEMISARCALETLGIPQEQPQPYIR